MFDSIVLRRSESGQTVSAGQIAEALLYYQKVHLVLDRGALGSLVKQIGTDWTLTLLRRPDVSAVYCEEMLGTQTESVGAFQIHRCVAFTLTGHLDLTLPTPRDRLQFEMERLGIEKKKAKHFSKGFLELAPVRKLSGHHFLKNGITEAATNDILQSEYARSAVRSIISNAPGGYDPGEMLKFDVVKSELGLNVFSNIDFQRINAVRAEMDNHDPLTTAHLLTAIQDVRADLALASHYGGDFVTSKQNSSVLQIRHAELLRRSDINQDARQQFQEIALPDTPSLAEVIDSGQRSFADFIRLLEKASKFKDWLKSTNPDEGLIREYLKSANSQDWIQKLPAKSIRYIFSKALDAKFPGASLAYDVFDNFIVEKLLSGWRPSHFVDMQLVPFSTLR
jgi:6-pyruvoyl-tetrahydropterin synthase